MDAEIAVFVGDLAGALVLAYIGNKIVNWVLAELFRRLRPSTRAWLTGVIVALFCVATNLANLRLCLAFVISVCVWLVKDLKRPDRMGW